MSDNFRHVDPATGLPRPEDLAEDARIVSQVATHPAFIALLDEIRAAPESDRLATAERLANLEELRARGLELPAGSRLTTRYFEDPYAALAGSVKVDSENVTDIGPDKAVGSTICYSLGFFACVTVGHTEIYSGPPLT